MGPSATAVNLFQLATLVASRCSRGSKWIRPDTPRSSRRLPDLGPAQKRQRVRDLTTTRHVAILGDAFEDASARDAATVTIAIGSTAAGADPRVDVILLGTDIAPLVAVFRLARRTRRVILANITGTLLFDVTGIALAAAGILSPLVAVLLRASAELAFILNSSRLAAD
jgi:Cd2+/Zn2+-exporting ATPase/Cu+-exporting ATPase